MGRNWPGSLLLTCTRVQICNNVFNTRLLCSAGAEISVAVNRSWKDENGARQEVCVFIDCTLWGWTAEVAGQYLKAAGQQGSSEENLTKH